MIYSQRDVYIVLMFLVYDFYIGLFDADTGISQAVDADNHHGLVALHTAKLALEVLQRAADNADLIARLEDVVVHLDSALGMTEHELESFYLGFGNEGWGILTGKSEELVDKGIGNETAAGRSIGTDKDNHGNDDYFYLLLAVAPLMDFPLGGDIVFNLEVVQPLADHLLMTRLNECGYPMFR